MKNLILTVAIPNYNGAQNLARCIASCEYINLKMDEFEILVVDNASNDNSINTASLLAKKFPNIRMVVNETNIGRIGNWNRCLDLAQGKYVMFLFPTEEICRTNNIAFVIKKMEETEIIVAKSEISCKRGLNPACIKRERGDLKIKNFKSVFLKAIILSGSLPFGPLQSFVIKTSFIKKNNIKFDGKYHIVGDQDFIINIGKTLSDNMMRADYLFTENINIIFDDTFKNRMHNQLSQYSRLYESLDLIEQRQYYRFVGLKFNDILYFVLAQLLLLDKIYGYKKDHCGREIYENDKKIFYKKFHYNRSKLLLLFFVISWVKILRKIMKVAKNLMKFNIVCILKGYAIALSARKKNR